MIIDSTGITQITLSQQPVHGMKFMGLSYIPDCLLAEPVTTHKTGLIANALSFLETASALRPEGRPVCSRSLLREALLTGISRLPQFSGSAAHKEADDTFCTLLTLDKTASTHVKGPPVSDEEIIRAVWSNKRAFYLYQLFRMFADCEHFAVCPLKFFQDIKRATPVLKTSQDCYNILRMELITRALLQRSGPPPEEVIKRDLSRVRAPFQSDTSYRYCRVSHLPRGNADQAFSVAVHYSRGDRWIHWGSWHVPGAEHLYKGMAKWTTYGRKTTASTLYLAS